MRPDDPAAPELAPSFTLEENQPLSASCLWRAQRAFFHRQGIEAWRRATVPHYVTNNPALARAYARVVLGYLRDLHDHDRAARPVGLPVPVEPLHIVEIGAGSGRFGFLFLGALLDLLGRSSLRGFPLRYVMTDFTASNLAFWEQHPSLAPLVEQGVLDFALFDAERDTTLTLRRAGLTLVPGALRRPLVVIANYVFDSIPQDAFLLHDGVLHESLVTITSPTPDLPATGADPFSDLTLRYSHRPARSDHYPEPELNDLLATCARAGAAPTLLFPIAALRCIARLANLAGGRLLLLSGDRDDRGDERDRDPGDPGLTLHGSLSMLVNYDAIGRSFLARAGHVLRMTHRHAHLNVVGLLLGEQLAGYPETHLAFDESLSRADPDDFFNLRRGIQGFYDKLGLDQLLSLVRMSHHDPRILRDCLPALRGQAAGASPAMRAEIVQTVQRVWDSYYPIGEARDLAFELGALLHDIEAWAPALALFEASQRERGDQAQTRWNMGLCHAGLGQTESALRCFGEAFSLDPSFRPPVAPSR